MPRHTNPLAPSNVANARPKSEPYSLHDGGGLFLLVQPNGSRWWRFRYSRPGNGSRNTLALGTFPDVSLKRAREKRDDARRLIADGIDPGAKRKADLTAPPDTFAALAREWMEQTEAKRVASTNKTIRERVEADLLPWLGERPIASITAPELL
ncbi:MAG: integrase arm-type DNA-binding domain-containing protein, partial [Xanthomonadaceae bacterium]|nr:integrase arm-type DNA-binding domain-containing protein [Xanthomonadaceae bacterium]